MIDCAQGHIGRVFVLRLKPGDDVLCRLELFCHENGIASGAVLCGIGSLRAARFLTPVPQPEKQAGFGYGDMIKLPGPIELLGMSGAICADSESNVSLHIHCTFSDGVGKSYGGHLAEGNLVLLTLEIVLAEITGVGMTRELDSSLDVMVLNPKQIL